MGASLMQKPKKAQKRRRRLKWHEPKRVSLVLLIGGLIAWPIWLLVWIIGSLRDVADALTHFFPMAIHMIAMPFAAFADGASYERNLATARRELRSTLAPLGRIFHRLFSMYGLRVIADAVGDVLAGIAGQYSFQKRYRILRTLPAGGSTAMLFVVEPRNTADVAAAALGDGPFVLKYFDLDAGSRLEQLVRENRSLDGAKRIGQIIDYHIGQRTFWYTMPFFEGPTLSKSGHSKDLGLNLRRFRSLLLKIEDIHDRGMIHKDVKPDNIIVQGDELCLVDLGLMTDVASAMTLTTQGTEYFRDPDMVRQALSGARVKDTDACRFDIYSAGAVLYTMVEGDFPACSSLSPFSKSVPLAIQWVVRQSMAQAKQRYPSIKAFRGDVEVCLEALQADRLEKLKPADLPSLGGTRDPETGQRVPGSETCKRKRGRRVLRLAALSACLMLTLLVWRKNARRGNWQESVVVTTTEHPQPQQPFVSDPVRMLSPEERVTEDIAAYHTSLCEALEQVGDGERPALVLHVSGDGAEFAPDLRQSLALAELVEARGMQLVWPNNFDQTAPVFEQRDAPGSELRRVCDAVQESLQLKDDPVFVFAQRLGPERAKLLFIYRGMVESQLVPFPESVPDPLSPEPTQREALPAPR